MDGCLIPGHKIENTAQFFFYFEKYIIVKELFFIEKYPNLSMVAHACNLSIWEVEERGSGMQDQMGMYSDL